MILNDPPELETDGAIVYVTASGSDAKPGNSWPAAKATIQAAINSLPANGGIVEVGFGVFAGFTIDTNVNPRYGIKIRGRGIGQSQSVTDATVPSPGKHPTRINTPCLINAQNASGVPESNWISPIVIEDLAIAGVNSSTAFTGTTTNGVQNITGAVVTGLQSGDLVVGAAGITAGSTILSISGSTVVMDKVATGANTGLTAFHAALVITGGNPNTHLRNVAIDSNAGCGLVWGASPPGPGVGATFFNQMEGVRCLKNAGIGMTGNLLTTHALNCNFDGNGASGVQLGLSGSNEEVTFINCTFQRNGNFGCWLQGTGQFFIGCQFENNGVVDGSDQFRHDSPSTSCLWGCRFNGDNTSHFAFNLFQEASSAALFVQNCYFAGHLTASVGIPGVQHPGYIEMSGNQSSDPLFAQWGTVNYAANLAANHILIGQSHASGVNQQTLAANGAVTMDASFGNVQSVLLQANATASSITNATPGQQLTVEWIQDGTGSRTYAWPPNCKFAGAAAPTASTTANFTDSVTFRFDGTNWKEVSRAAAIH